MKRLLLAFCALVSLADVASAQTEAVEYYAQDTVGSIRIVFAPNGTVLGRQDYGPFGAALLTATNLPKEGFAAQETDDETSQTYFHARLFQRRIGRFNAVDPQFSRLFEPQHLNRYSYGLNNPIRYGDPTGLNAQANCVWTEVAVDTGLTAYLSCPANNPNNEPAGGGTGFSVWDWLAERLADTFTGTTVTDNSDLHPSGGGGASYTPPPALEIAVGAVAIAAIVVSPVKAGLAASVEKSVVTAAEKAVAKEVFHYTSAASAKNILRTGLNAESYATTTGKLSPLQAQIDLALRPNRRLPDTILRIDLEAMVKDGYEIPSVRTVARKFNMPGGGLEYFFPYPIPPTYIKPF